MKYSENMIPAIAGLPVNAVLGELAAALRRERRAVLAAPPGTGKTTLVPGALLDGFAGKIIMLEPRRLAARAAAGRIAALFGENPGGTVGYRMRGETKVGARTRIEVVTEGVLTRMLQADPELTGVDVLIFDEFHERNLHGDLGLALALDVQGSLRPDLALLVMSATLDAGRIAAFLSNAPVIRAEGRLFPVAEHFGEPFGELRRLAARTAAAVKHLLARENGNLLVFLPGAGEIEAAARLLTDCGDDVLIAPLYGNLDFAEQERAILPPPPGMRKVVLATNIAESSLTIDGVRVVVDSGYERVNRFDPGSGMPRLELSRISRASALQRAGRAGRCEPGAVYRLYSEHDFRLLAEFAAPEICEADLAMVQLELARWGSAAGQLRWLDPPPEAALGAAAALLTELGVFDTAGKLTAAGRQLAELPVHPRLGMMLVEAAKLRLAPLAAELAALLEERDIAPDAPGADLADRLRRYRGRPGAYRRVTAIRDQLCRLLRIDFRALDIEPAGLLLSFAYPDWVAQSRGSLSPSYLLACGRGARLGEGDDLRRSEYLAVARLDRAGAEAGIRLAAHLSEADLRLHFKDRIADVELIRFDRKRQRVTAERETRFGALVLNRAPLGAPPPAAAARVLADAVRETGFHVLSLDPAALNLAHRVRFAARAEPGAFPDFSEAGLLDLLPELLLQNPEARSFDDLRRIDFRNLLATRLGFGLLARLDRDYPERFTAPTGSKLKINYDAEVPTLPVRVQELYGLNIHPALGNGRLPLKLELLSPAGRTVQITSDLPAFWKTNWELVRKEMRSQYPKHLWPEDPAAAAPTTRAKPRPNPA